MDMRAYEIGWHGGYAPVLDFLGRPQPYVGLTVAAGNPGATEMEGNG